MESITPLRLLKEHNYAIIDQAAGQTVPEDWPSISLAPDRYANQAHLFPKLIPLFALKQAQHIDLLERIELAIGRTEQLPLSCLFASSLDEKRMRAHWHNRLFIPKRNGGTGLLRSYDGRVFSQLIWMLRPGQLARLFGSISKWTFFLDGAWHTHFPPSADTRHETISPEQFDQLTRIGAINQVIAALAPSNASDRIDLGKKIDALLVRALKHGLRSEREQIAFAMHGLTVHEQFDCHPRIRKIIQDVDLDEQTYCDAVASLSEVDWRAIRIDLLSNTSPPFVTS